MTVNVERRTDHLTLATRYAAQLPGQATELPDHGGPAGTGRRFGSHHIHRVAKHGNHPAVSIHVYGPALRTMTRFRLGPAGLEIVSIDPAGAQR